MRAKLIPKMHSESSGISVLPRSDLFDRLSTVPSPVNPCDHLHPKPLRRHFSIRFPAMMALISLVLLSCGTRESEEVFTGLAQGRVVMVPALTGGKLLELRVDEGEPVTEGDTLAVLDTLELVLQKKQLQASLEELTVREQLARSDLSRATADLEYARQRYERVRALHDQGAATQQALDDVHNVLTKAETAHRAARLQLQALRAKREQVVAQLKLVNKKISDSVILCPQTGIVTERFFEPGEAVAPLRPVVEITRLDRMEIRIYVPEPYLWKVKQGSRAIVRVDGLERELEGTIAWVSSKAEFSPKNILTPETRASLVYAVEIHVPNQDGILKDGMPVEVVLPNR